MNAAEIKRRIAEVEGKIDAIFTAQDNGADEKGDPRPPTSDEIVELKKLHEEINELESRLADTAEGEKFRRAYEERKQAARPRALPTPTGEPAEDFKTDTVIGRIVEKAFQNSDFKAFLEKIPQGTRVKIGESPALELKGLSLKTLITGASSTSGGALIVNDRTSIIDPGTAYRPIDLFTLIPREPTNSDTVEFVREGSHTNAGAPVSESTQTGAGSGAKPESAMTLSVIQSPVQTVAHWIPATRQALSDAPRLMAIIENFLNYGLLEELEDQVLNGSGTAPNLTGINNYTGTTAQAWDTNILTTTRKARTKVRSTGRARPNAYVLNPTDWETIDLLQDNEARYFFGGPSQIGAPRLWGLPVVESEGISAGIGFVADWNLSRIWEREAPRVLISDSHADFFTRNMIAVLCEMRVAFDLLRPAAFVEMDLTA